MYELNKDGPRSAAEFHDEGVNEMKIEPEFANDFLWDGYLAPGEVTLLTAMWKTGKTTLLAGLLGRLRTGGEYCGQALRPGRALVISEESRKLWRKRAEVLDLSAVRFLCRPFQGRPTDEGWDALLEHIAAMHRECRLDLVVIDPLAAFLPGGCESDAKSVMNFLLKLQKLTVLGISVLLKHHPRKGEAPIGSISRGSGALTASIDIVLEMYRVGKLEDNDRRRVLIGLSRHEETLVRLVVEFDPARHEYVKAAEQVVDEFQGGWPILRVVLEDAWKKLTRQAILKEWPPDFPKPHVGSLWIWLDRAVRDGLVLRDGLGRKNKPFRYWLPGAEDRWLDRGVYLEDPPDLDPPPDDADATAKKLHEISRTLFAKQKRK
jgi:AAA domain